MTPFDDIYDLFLVEIRDYKIDNLYNTSPAQFEIYLQGFLVLVVTDFSNCAQSLVYNTTTQTFTSTLTNLEISILSSLMVLRWLTKEINNVNQINLHLNDTDFKLHAASQNLNAKIEHRDRLREIVNQDMTNYSLKNVLWSEWYEGNYANS